MGQMRMLRANSWRGTFVVVLVAFIVAAVTAEREAEDSEVGASAESSDRKWAWVPNTKSVAQKQKKAVKILAKTGKPHWVLVPPGKTASQVNKKKKKKKKKKKNHSG